MVTDQITRIKSRPRWQNCFGAEIVMDDEPIRYLDDGRVAVVAPKYPLSHVKVLPTETDSKDSQKILDKVNSV